MKTIEEINRAIHDGETPPLACIHDFLEHVTRENFDRVYAELDPKLQSHVIDQAKLNIHFFDEIIEDFRARGVTVAVEPWLAYKEWAERQPWADEARAQPKPIVWTPEQMDAFLAAEYAEALANMGRFMQKKAGGEGAEEWKAAVQELESTAKMFADRADAIVPKKK